MNDETTKYYYPEVYIIGFVYAVTNIQIIHSQNMLINFSYIITFNLKMRSSNLQHKQSAIPKDTHKIQRLWRDVFIISKMLISIYPKRRGRRRILHLMSTINKDRFELYVYKKKKNHLWCNCVNLWVLLRSLRIHKYCQRFFFMSIITDFNFPSSSFIT